MNRYDLVINGVNYAVEIVSVGGTRASVRVNGVAYDVKLPASAAPAAPASAPLPEPVVTAPPAAAASPSPAAPAPAAAAGPAGSEVITAPMPGHILNVPVKQGDTVAVGDTVMVMEAMKMENEIKAHVAGTVLEVKASKGQDVGVGEVLLIIGA